MGLLRLYLALSVVFQHAGKSWGISGRRAVEIFFIISGFYMALILTTGKYKEYKTFIINRILRLYPVYFVIAISTLVLSFLYKIPPLPQYVAYGKDFDLWTLSYLILSNITLFGQDLALFMGIHEGHLFGAVDFNKTAPYVYGFLLVPQAWSLSLELLFYCIVPAFLWQKTRTKVIALSTAIFLSILCKIGLVLMDIPYDPWAYRFFPSVLSLFLIGSLIYHIYDYYLLQLFQKIHVMGCLAAVGLVNLAYWMGGISKLDFSIKRSLQKIPALQDSATVVAEVINATIPFVGWAFLICILFYLTSKSHWDRWVGELSYPLYVVHLLVINTLATFIAKDSSFPYWVVGVSVLLSIGLVLFVQNPVDRYRASRLKAKNALPEMLQPEKRLKQYVQVG